MIDTKNKDMYFYNIDLRKQKPLIKNFRKSKSDDIFITNDLVNWTTNFNNFNKENKSGIATVIVFRYRKI